MADTILQTTPASYELVAYYLLASMAANERNAAVNVRDGIPIISGMDKEWLLTNYADCLRTITMRKAQL